MTLTLFVFFLGDISQNMCKKGGVIKNKVNVIAQKGEGALKLKVALGPLDQ